MDNIAGIQKKGTEFVPYLFTVYLVNEVNLNNYYDFLLCSLIWSDQALRHNRYISRHRKILQSHNISQQTYGLYILDIS